MVTDQEKFQTQIKFDRFLCEGMFQVPLQERHPVPRHQIVGQPDQRKLPAIQRRLPTDFSRSGNLGHQIQLSLPSYCRPNQFGYRKVLPQTGNPQN